VTEWASRNGIPFFCPEKINLPEWVDRIRERRPDMLFSFYYRRLLGKEILDIPLSGAFNLHGSFLPAYRGRCPVNWVLVNGERRTGVTLHWMVPKADAGDIVGQREVPIDFEDTALTLYRKLCTQAGLLLDDVLPLLAEGRAPRIPQDHSLATTFGGRTPEDGKIDWQWPSLRIYNLIRAVTDPYPGAFALLPQGGKLFLWRATPASGAAAPSLPGTVEIEGEAVFAATADGRLCLHEIEAEGKRLTGEDIAQYFSNRKGTILK
jgi:UDP-4-amino-4-deoxy-L-arabinose formyltransferase/UDP-glucuronic acid dehydrogenase (UDP-4-keto-hexauronic acid decarboxylating)